MQIVWGPCVGLPAAVEGFLRGVCYGLIGVSSCCCYSLHGCDENAHKNGFLIAGRESCLFLGGSCAICVFPCSMPCVVTWDPGMEDPPGVGKTISACGWIDARRFSLLWQWPLIWGLPTYGEGDPLVGHPRWAFLGKLRPHPGTYESRRTDWYDDVSSCSDCDISENKIARGKDRPLFCDRTCSEE